jgi:hypothetical protein
MGDPSDLEWLSSAQPGDCPPKRAAYLDKLRRQGVRQRVELLWASEEAQGFFKTQHMERSARQMLRLLQT